MRVEFGQADFYKYKYCIVDVLVKGACYSLHQTDDHSNQIGIYPNKKKRVLFK